MRDLFRGLLELPEVRGVALFSPQGTLLFEDWRGAASPLGDPAHALTLIATALGGSREADLAFSRGRTCLRQTRLGPLVAVIGPGGSAAMVRLQLDLLVPSLGAKQPKKGLLGLFGTA